MEEWPDSIIVFDGVCNLCTRSVSFIIRHDQQARFRFASIQSAAGQRLCRRFGINPDQFDTVLLIQRDAVRGGSDAALAIATTFGGLWRLVALVRFVPRRVRDWAYGVVSRSRYRWFGRHTTCMVPSDDVRQRFIDL